MTDTRLALPYCLAPGKGFIEKYSIKKDSKIRIDFEATGSVKVFLFEDILSIREMTQIMESGEAPEASIHMSEGTSMYRTVPTRDIDSILIGFLNDSKWPIALNFRFGCLKDIE